MRNKTDRLADTPGRVNRAPPQAVLVKLCDRMENLIDARDQPVTFHAVYIPLTDMLLVMLAENAVRHGYRNALETRKGTEERLRGILNTRLCDRDIDWPTRNIPLRSIRFFFTTTIFTGSAVI